MTSTTLISIGLCIIGLILVLLAIVTIGLLADILEKVPSRVNDESIHNQGSKAMKAIDQARHKYLDHIYSDQMDKENQND